MRINYTGIDWVTATTNSDKVGQEWWTLVTKHISMHQEGSFVNNRWSNAYYTGIGLEGLNYGYHEKRGYIIIAKSDVANSLWPKLRKGPKRVTRLDLCVDIVMPKPKAIAKSAYKRMLKNKDIPKNRKFHLYENREGGTTLYVGSRQSPAYGRLYDKGVESGMAKPGLYWRYEVEFKKPYSMAMVDCLQGMTGQALDTEITRQVAGWFVDHYVDDAAKITRGERRPVLAMQRQTTADRKLAWLRTQVSPTIRMLMDAGLGRQVALSLFQQPGDILEMLHQADLAFFDPELPQEYNITWVGQPDLLTNN